MAQRDVAEMRAYHELMSDVGERILPRNMPPELLPLMAPAALHPDQAARVLQQVQQQAPILHDLGVRIPTESPCECHRLMGHAFEILHPVPMLCCMLSHASGT